MPWIFTIYVLMQMISTPLMAKLSDYFGRRAIYVLDIALFAADIAGLSRIVTLNDLTIAPVANKPNLLTLEASAKTFRYLDDEEVAAQRKAKDAQKAPKK